MKNALRLLSASWSLVAAYRNDFRKSLAIAENLTLGVSQDRVHFFVNDGSSRSGDGGKCCCKVLDAFKDCESVGGLRFKSDYADGIFPVSEKTWCCKKVVPPFSLMHKMSMAKLSCDFKGNDYTLSLNKIRNPMRRSWWNKWSTGLLALASRGGSDADLRNAVELIRSEASTGTGPNPGDDDDDVGHFVNSQTREVTGPSFESYLMTGRSEYCTVGFDILSESECKLAARVLGLKFGRSWEGPNAHKNCFYGEDTAKKRRVFFNIASDKAAIDVSTLKTDFQSLCYEAHYVPPVIWVSEATGTNAGIVNGAYDLNDLINERPSWKKRDSKHWLVWNIENKNCWSVTGSKTNPGIYAVNSKAALPIHPGAWKVYMGQDQQGRYMWESQNLVIQELEVPGARGEKLGAPWAFPSYSFSLTDCSASLNGQQVPSFFGGMKWVQVNSFMRRSYNYKIPAVLAAMVSALRLKNQEDFPDASGILRLSGNMEKVEELQEKVSNGEITIQDLQDAETATIVGVLKQRFSSMSKKVLDFVPNPRSSQSITSLILMPKTELQTLVQKQGCSMIKRTPEPMRTVVLYWFDFLWQIVNGMNKDSLRSIARLAAEFLLSNPPEIEEILLNPAKGTSDTQNKLTLNYENKETIVSALMQAHRFSQKC